MNIVNGNTVNTNSQGKELRIHGTWDFPVACYRVDMPQLSIPWHWHDELEIDWIVEGNIKFNISSGEYTLKTGEGFFINAGIPHAINGEEGVKCIFHSMVFHPRFIGGGMDSIFWQKYVLPLINDQSFPCIVLSEEGDCPKELIPYANSAWKFCTRGEDGYEIFTRNTMSMFLYALHKNQKILRSHLSPKTLRNNERIKLMLQYIHETYMEPLTVEQIAKSASISVSECLRCFKATIGTSPVAYLKRYRLQKATDMLAAGYDKISVIAQECGFMELSYFAKSFKEVYGCTPSQYQKT